MKLAPFTGPGSTPARRRFWDQARATVLASQKLEGRNVTVSEHIGKGTIINARRDRGAAPSGDCGPPNLCTVDFAFTCDVWTPSQSGLPIPNPPRTCSGLGWRGQVWVQDCANDACTNLICYCADLFAGSCKCGIRLDWIEDATGAPDPATIRIILNKIEGDGTLADGWYMYVAASWESNPPDLHCTWETSVCYSPPCTCIYLGADDTIFDTDLEVEAVMLGGSCGGDGSIVITFHPC